MSKDDRVRPLEEVLARYRKPPVRYQPDWSARVTMSPKEAKRTMREVLQKPLPGSIRRAVYDVLSYTVGQTELDIWVATSDLTNEQIYRALHAMQEIGLVEGLHQNGMRLWYLVGASQHNNPTTDPPVPPR